jgi:hypothetical protein
MLRNISQVVIPIAFAGVLYHRNCEYYGPVDAQFRFPPFKRNGRGFQFYGNGDIYYGDWKDGEKHGEGIYLFEDGRIYVGDYREGKRDGFGFERTFFENKRK